MSGDRVDRGAERRRLLRAVGDRSDRTGSDSDGGDDAQDDEHTVTNRSDAGPSTTATRPTTTPDGGRTLPGTGDASEGESTARGGRAQADTVDVEVFARWQCASCGRRFHEAPAECSDCGSAVVERRWVD